MIKMHFPGLPVKGSEYREGSSCIISDSGKNCIVIDGGESTMLSKSLAYVRQEGITHVTHILTHWHPDHDRGLKGYLDASGIFVDRIYCPPIAEMRNLDSDDFKRGTSICNLAKSLNKPIINPPAAVWTEIKVGEIRAKIWRRAASTGDYKDYRVNNTSMQIYFPELFTLITGDTIIIDSIIPKLPGKVVLFDIPHHGNACPATPSAKLKNQGALYCIYDDIEPRGTIGQTSFTSFGAKRTKDAGITTLCTTSDIDVVFVKKTATIAQKGKTWTFPVLYDGTVEEGWKYGTKGWWYQYSDGSWPTGWAVLPWSGGKSWFFFDKSGWMQTGWIKDGGYWYYCDPSTGAMQTGWLTYHGKMCYLEPEAGKNQGHAYCNQTAVIDGKTYYFDENCYASEVGNIGDAISRVVQIAKNEVGYKEKSSNRDLESKTANAGSNNYTKYGRDMHNIYPKTMDFPAAWCDAFVDWCFYKAFGKDVSPQMLCGAFDDYTVNSAGYFKKAGRWHTVPEVGDQIFFKDGSGGICHTGIVYKVYGGKVYTIEGNSNNEVRYCEYPETSSKIAGYGRPRWEMAAQGEPVKKTVDEIAREVIEGKWGVGDVRVQLLKDYGYDPDEVQKKVNELMRR